MTAILTSALPFFGLIFLGYAAGLIRRLPQDGLAWLNVFIVYVSLPALFFDLLSRTPFEELSNLRFVAATTLTTFCAFSLAFVIGLFAARGHVREATIQGLIGGYPNIGYMGPGLTLSVLGPAAAVPTALIFCFDNALLFTLVPILMAFGEERRGLAATALTILRRVALHPFILASAAGVLAAYWEWLPPAPIAEMLRLLRGAAAPCALFALGVTVALTPPGRFPVETAGLLIVKLLIQPALAVLFVSQLAGDADPVWRNTAILMAALPPALNVFVLAQSYDVAVQRASGGILAGTALSVFTVTLLIYLVKTDALP